MLQTIRDRATGWFAWLIVIFITVPFALWGIQEYFGPSAKLQVAKINGVEISQHALQQATQDERNRLQSMFGGKLPADLFSDEQLRRQALERLIGSELRFQVATAAGMRIGDMQLVSRIQAVEAFRKEGRFDQESYEQRLRSVGLNPATFEMQMRRDLLEEQFYRAVADSAFVTAADRRERQRLEGQIREVSYVLFKAAEREGQVAVTDEGVKAYYDAHQAQFSQPEQAKIQYVELKLADLAAALPVTEEALRNLYQEQRERFLQAEQRRVRHILVTVNKPADEAAVAAAKARAEALLARVRGGEEFAAVAKEASQDPGSAAQGGDLGFFGKGVMDPAFEQAAFALSPGEISDVIHGSFGFHILKLEEVQAPRVKEYAEVKGELETELRRREAEPRFAEQLDTLTTLAYEHPDSLKEVAAALELPIRDSDWFSRDGGEGIVENPKVAAAAFDEDVLEKGNNSAPVELGSDAAVVLRVADRRPAAPKPLAEVRDEVVKALKAEGSAKLAHDEGEALLKTLREGGDAQGAVWHELGAVDRHATADNLPQVVRAAFQLPRPGDRPSLGSATLGGGDYAVVRVSKVVDGAPKGEDKEGDAQVARLEGNAEFAAVAAGLRAQAKIEVAEEQR